ncbi:ABC transporter permease [Euzebya sp.]|uniref:ABC transporter permease n=1 Tax=Euzebya sp. TaxID=1971409 RepID=UPI003518DFD6
MRIALRELLRQPGRFLPVGGALTLLVVLLVVLGGFLDGLELSQTGSYRAHEGSLLVFADDVELQIQRSQVGEDAVSAIADLDDVDQVGTLDQVATTAGLPASSADPESLEDIVLFGYEVGTDALPAPPDGDGAVVDAVLADLVDVEVGDTIELGPDAVPVTVDALVDDLSQGSPTVWVASDRWREIAATATPTGLPPEGTAQALVVRPDAEGRGGAPTADDLRGLADAIDTQVDGVAAVTPTEAIEALPVVQQQSSTFRGIIGVTFAVTLLVVALFFALITLERVALYAVLKALGARSVDLLTGISAQAVVISAGALVLGIGLSIAFTAALPPELPIRLVPLRLAAIAGGTVLTALIGSLFTLRRLLAIDPADAIG